MTQLAEIIKKVKDIPHDDYAEDGGFSFTKAETVVNTVLEALNKQGFTFYPESGAEVAAEEGIVRIRENWIVRDADGKLVQTIVSWGEGAGNDAAYKAQTGSRKYAMARLAGISFVKHDNEHTPKTAYSKNGSKGTGNRGYNKNYRRYNNG